MFEFSVCTLVIMKMKGNLQFIWFGYKNVCRIWVVKTRQYKMLYFWIYEWPVTQRGLKLAAIVISSWVLRSNVHRASGSEWLMMPNVSYFYLTSDEHICRNVCKQLKHDGFVWPIDNTVTGRFVSNMEFFYLKVADPSVSYCWVEFDSFLHILVGNISEFL